MAWEKVIIISGGELEGTTIDISDNMVTQTLPSTVGGLNNGGTDTIQSSQPYYYNQDLVKQINVSSYFTLSHADFSDECFADISILDENEEISGFFSLYVTRSGLRVEVTGKVKNASGVVVGTFGPATGVINMDSRVNPTCYFCLCRTESNGKVYYGMYFNLNQKWNWMSRDYSMACFAGAYINDTDIYDFFGIAGSIDRTIKETSPEFGPPAAPGGGYIPGGGQIPGGGTTPGGGPVIKVPTFDNTSDKVEISTKPTLSAIASKFLHAYVVTEQSLEYIGDALFPQPVFQQPDLITAMGELGQIIFFNKQVDYMLDLLILPIDVPHGDWEPLNVGGRQLSTVIGGTTYFINGQPADDCYIDVTCGSISVDEYWVNFLDFAGTKVKLFLPYVGYVDIQPEYVIGGTLYVDYRFNILDGSFMAYVRSDSGYSQLEESLICQYAGVAAVHIPLQSKDYSAKISGLISAIGTVGAGAVSGGIGAAAAAGASANAANTIVQKPGTSHANGYNASSSFLSHRKPYLIIERQWSQFSQKYPEEVGIPSNVMCRLGDLYGLVKSANAHLDVIPCSVEGKEKIGQLLADGIIL